MDHVLPIQKNKIKHIVYIFKVQETDTKPLSISLYGLVFNKFIHWKKYLLSTYSRYCSNTWDTSVNKRKTTAFARLTVFYDT